MRTPTRCSSPATACVDRKGKRARLPRLEKNCEISGNCEYSPQPSWIRVDEVIAMASEPCGEATEMASTEWRSQRRPPVRDKRPFQALQDWLRNPPASMPLP